jgi:uncharacterized protein YkwD
MNRIRIEITENGAKRDFDVVGPIFCGRRGEDVELSLDDIRCSRRHCRIEPASGGVRVVDLDSSNGTFVNGLAISQSIVRPGDEMRIGGVTMRVFLTGAPEEKKVGVTAPARAPRKPAPTGRTAAVAEARPTPDPFDRSRAPVDVAAAVESESSDLADERPGIARRPAASSSKSRKLILTALLSLSALGVAFYFVDRRRADEAEKKAIADRFTAAVVAFENRRFSDAVRDFEKVAAETRDDDLRDKASAKARLARAEADRDDEERRFVKSIGDPKDGVLPSGQETRLSYLAREAMSNDVRGTAQSIVATMKARRFSAITGVLDDAAPAIQVFVDSHRFAEALKAVDALKPEVDRVDSDDARSLFFERRRAVEEITRKHFEETRIAVDVMAKSDQVAPAIVAMEACAEAMRGTSCESEAAAALADFKARMGERAAAATSRKTDELVPAPGDRDFSPRGIEVLAEAEKAATAFEWAKAAQGFEAAAAAVRTKGEAAHCLRRRDVFLAMSRLKTHAIEVIRSKKITPTIKWSGRISSVAEASDETVALGLGDVGKAVVKWRDLGADRLWDLFEDCATTPELRADLCVVGWVAGKKDLAEKTAVSLAKSKDSKRIVEPLWAACRDIELPAGGFEIFGDRLLTPEEAVVARNRAHFAALAEKLKSADSREAAALVSELAAAGKGAESFLLSGLSLRRDDLVDRIEKSPRLKDIGGARTTLVAELQAARKLAFELINDTVKYPYPYAPNQAEIQSEVDARVDRVKAIWERPYDSFVALDEPLRALDDSLKETEKWLADAGKTPTGRATMIDLWQKKLEIDKAARSAAELKSADEVEAVNTERAALVSDDEREVHRLVNEYRTMMGLRRVKIDEGLVLAARGHSQEMADLGYFSHDSPTKGLETPSQRAQKEGFGGGVGENIAQGQPRPIDAFLGWTHSSGHHRNILNPRWNALGVGKSKAGNYWTQNFGSGQSTRREKAKE